MDSASQGAVIYVVSNGKGGYQFVNGFRTELKCPTGAMFQITFKPDFEELVRGKFFKKASGVILDGGSLLTMEELLERKPPECKLQIRVLSMPGGRARSG